MSFIFSLCYSENFFVKNQEKVGLRRCVQTLGYCPVLGPGIAANAGWHRSERWLASWESNFPFFSFMPQIEHSESVQVIPVHIAFHREASPALCQL